jgi:hypothetical protein
MVEPRVMVVVTVLTLARTTRPARVLPTKRLPQLLSSSSVWGLAGLEVVGVRAGVGGSWVEVEVDVDVGGCGK